MYKRSFLPRQARDKQFEKLKRKTPSICAGCWWIRADMNWNLVSNGAIAIAALVRKMPFWGRFRM
jgi:hypothetical protein